MRSTEQIVADMFEGDPEQIVPGCFITVNGEQVVLHPAIALLRNKALAQREQERLVYCDANDIDPDRYTGCYACEGTGFHRINRLPCFCDIGRIRSMQQAAVDLKETTRLREVLSRPQVVEEAA